MMFDFGDIVVVNFPFTNNLEGKKRPAVVVSSSRYNEEKEDLILLAITSKVDKMGFGERLIENWSEAGLLKQSSFKSVIFTIEKQFVFKKLGKLSSKDTENLSKCLQEIIQFT